MDFMKYRVKVQEDFKDGNVLGGKFLKAGTIEILSEQDFAKVVNSGGVLEIIESVIPNPLKKDIPEAVAVKARQAEEAEEAEKEIEAQVSQANEVIYRQEAEEQKEQQAPKRRGRPRKNVA